MSIVYTVSETIILFITLDDVINEGLLLKFLLTACTLIGYFNFTWHLTMKLFPAKIPERATLQKSMTSVGNNALFHLGKH